MKKYLLALYTAFMGLTGMSYSLENSEFYAGLGVAFIDPELEDFISYNPIVLNGGYLYHFGEFNAGLDLDIGYGGEGSQNLFYWKAGLASRVDFPIEATEVVLPFVQVDAGALGATLKNSVHPAAISNSSAGINVSKILFYGSVGGGLYYTLKNDNKIGFSLAYGFAKTDFEVQEGNPMGFRVKLHYLFDMK